MRTALPICVLLAVCVALPVSASAKTTPLSLGQARRPIYAPLPGDWPDERRLSRLREDHIVSAAYNDPDTVSNMQCQTASEARAQLNISKIALFSDIHH